MKAKKAKKKFAKPSRAARSVNPKVTGPTKHELLMRELRELKDDLSELLAMIGPYEALREQLAVQCSHNRRLLAEKESLLQRLVAVSGPREIDPKLVRAIKDLGKAWPTTVCLPTTDSGAVIVSRSVFDAMWSAVRAVLDNYRHQERSTTARDIPSHDPSFR